MAKKSKGNPAGRQTRQRDEFGLLPNWRLFADRVLAGEEGTTAYRKVFKNAKITSARVSACKLLQRPVVAEYIEGRRDRVAAVALAKLQVDADWIRKNAVAVVERCMAPDTFDAAGAIRALKLLSEDCPGWGSGGQERNLPVFVVLER